MLVFRFDNIGRWAGACLLLALSACAGKPWGRPIPQPIPPALNTQTVHTNYLQDGQAQSNGAVQPSSATLNPDGSISCNVVPASYAVAGPRSVRTISLSETLQIALQNSSVIRDLGGRLVTQPGATASNLNPILTGSDARIGIDAALSAFDAQLSASLNFRRNNRGLQQFVPQSNNTQISQHQADLIAGARRTLTTGTVVGVSHFVNYRRDDLGVPPNRFNSAYTAAIGADVRHPLALGSGKDFNLIAGPNAQAGVYNGIYIARVRQDLAHHDFEIAVRDYIANVVRTYWLLHFAYDRIDAQDRSLAIAEELWKAAKTKYAEGVVDADFEAQARDRYLSEQIARDNAAIGSPERTIAGILGTSGALLTGTEPGVEAIERRLRFLIGLPAYDGTILRPGDSPSSAPMVFDVHESLALAMQRRPELRRQNLVIHQKQMELAASRSFARPRVDLVSEARLLGFGDHLGGDDPGEDQDAIRELLQGQLQEWAMGIEMQRPVGLRLGRTAQRNAMYSLSKETEILRQQQTQVAHEINSALAEIERAQKVMDLTRHRREIAVSHLYAVQRKFEEGLIPSIEQVLEAQRAVTTIDIALSIAIVDRSIAINNLLVARGTSLQEYGCMVVSNEPYNAIGQTHLIQWNGLERLSEPQVEIMPPASTQPETNPEVILLPPESVMNP